MSLKVPFRSRHLRQLQHTRRHSAPHIHCRLVELLHVQCIIPQRLGTWKFLNACAGYSLRDLAQGLTEFIHGRLTLTRALRLFVDF